MMPTTHILFVCTGNICRSPMAEAILRHKINRIKANDRYVIDSAGTHGYHVGEPPDHRTIRICDQNGISTTGQTARQLKQPDFENFDLILGLDRGHVAHMQSMAPQPEHHKKLALLMEYCLGQNTDVPDPYYGGIQDFQTVFTMLDHALTQLIEKGSGI